MTGSPDVVRHAVAAARHGWYVFPLVRNAKRPGVADWEHEASNDPAFIAASWPKWATGYGICAGRSGLYVIDGDVPKPDTPPAPHPDVRTGLDMLAVLAEEAGESINFATFATRTGRGGDHLYYLMPEGRDLRNTASDQPSGLGWCLDTRGGGGYVIGPGSTVEGRRYEVVHIERPAPLPRWIVELLDRRKAEAQAASQGGGFTPGSTQSAAVRPAPGAVPVVGHQWAEAALAGEIAKLATLGEGGRNHALNAAAYTLGRLVGGGVLDRDAVAEALLGASSAWWGVGSPPFSRVEAEKTISSGLAAGERNPRTPVPAEPRKRAA